jgi:hypothetical protein
MELHCQHTDITIEFRDEHKPCVRTYSAFCQGEKVGFDISHGAVLRVLEAQQNQTLAYDHVDRTCSPGNYRMSLGGKIFGLVKKRSALSTVLHQLNAVARRKK